MHDTPPFTAGPVRLTRASDGIELHFPPLRAPGDAARLALFGAACLAPAALAALASAPAAGSDTAGWVALWLIATFIAPLFVFGVVFMVFAIYGLANSLTVRVSASGIRCVRRLLGIPLREHRIDCDNVAGLATVTAPGVRGFGQQERSSNLVVLTKSGRGLTWLNACRNGRLNDYRHRSITVAENLRGAELIARIRKEIIDAGRLTHPESGETEQAP
jgi:hypothetical protein